MLDVFDQGWYIWSDRDMYGFEDQEVVLRGDNAIVQIQIHFTGIEK